MIDLGTPHLHVGSAAQLGGTPLRYREVGVRVESPPRPDPLVALVAALTARVAAMDERVVQLEEARLSARLRRAWAACLRWLQTLGRWG